MRFDLKIHCTCNGCLKKVKELRRRIQGVDSIDIHKNRGIATISGTANPDTVIKALAKVKKHAVLLREQSQPVPPSKQVQESCNKKHQAAKGNAPITVTLDPNKLKKKHEKEKEKAGLQQPPVKKTNDHQQFGLQQQPVKKTNDRLRKVAPQPGLDESTRKRTLNCCQKSGHKLELKPQNKLFTCNGCEEEGFGPRYRCDPCDYDFHKECKSPKETTTHELFKGSTFTYLSKTDKNKRTCDACGWKIKGCSYHCEAKNLDMHPCCSKLKSNLCTGGTDFILRDKVKYKCLWCNKNKRDWIAENEVPGWSYVSKKKRICCHVHCMWPMVFEVWKKGGFHGTDDDDDTLTMALQKIDLKVLANSKRNGGGSRSEILKSVCTFLSEIIGILFGDPFGIGIAVLSTLMELMSTLYSQRGISIYEGKLIKV